MRIVSLVPAGTDIVCALGLARDLVGVSHECDVPADGARARRLTRSTVGTRCRSSADIHAAVAERAASGGPMYELDLGGLAALKPDLIVTQRLCDVCALPASAVEHALPDVAPHAAVVSLDGRSLDGMLDAIVAIGERAGGERAAGDLVEGLRARLARVAAAVAGREPVPVVCLEWLDPPFASGHWIPEMVSRAGGIELLGRPGIPSVPVEWEAIERLRPPCVIALPCGFALGRVMEELGSIATRAEWQRAIGEARVYAAAGGAYFTRPGPGLVSGVEVLASVLHREVAAWDVPSDAVASWR